MVTSSTCMLTIVTEDRERPRLLWKLTSWKSRAGMACSRSWHRFVSAPDFLKKWSPEDTWWSRARGACSRSWHKIVSTPDLSDEECSFGHGLRVLAHDRDIGSWAPQTAYKEWSTEVTSWGGSVTIVTWDRERPRVDTFHSLGSRCWGSRSWSLCRGRDALYHDRDGGSWHAKLSYFLAFFWCWSLHFRIDLLALIKPEIHLMEILVLLN